MLYQSAFLALLSMLHNPSAAATEGFVEGYPPPAVSLPEPLYLVHPSEDALLILGGYHSNGGLYGGYRWSFTNGKSLLAYWNPSLRTLEVVGRTVFYETEATRCSIVGGTRNGICYECYLGYGFSTRLDLTCSKSPIRLSLDCFPQEDIEISFGIDPLLRCWQLEWSSAP